MIQEICWAIKLAISLLLLQPRCVLSVCCAFTLNKAHVVGLLSLSSAAFVRL